jgi:hypothetical protein
VTSNKNIHSDKIKLRRFAMQLYFPGDVKRYVSKEPIARSEKWLM